MADLITLDVLDRPPGGASRALRTLARRRPPGLRGVVRLRTLTFKATYAPNQTPRRIALLSVWRPDADVAAGWRELLGVPAEAAREHWHVRGEVARYDGTDPLRGWWPDPAGAAPLADDEPALVLISGDLRARTYVPFIRDGVAAIGQAFGHPGYLGGLGLQASPLNTTSCSAWRSYADARDYAWAAGGSHATAVANDAAREQHVTACFVRARVLASSGTLAGRPVFSR